MHNYQTTRNTSHGHSVQINGPIYGNVGLTTDLQPSFFKTSNYESYKNINPRRVPGTCAWFLEHPTFQKWKTSSGDDLLWLSADPGCGKSVLSRALIDEGLLGAEPVTICHFFFKDNDEQNSVTTALCALLLQLFHAHEDLLQKHVAPAIKKCGHALKNDFEELWKIFISATTDPSAGNVICVVDALDECRQPDQDKFITHLGYFYGRSLGNFGRESKLKFLLTSRPYHEIERHFRILTRRIPTIRLAGEEESEKISYEIGIVMKSKLKEISEELDIDEEVQSFLYDRLRRIPNRTYLWLYLTLDEVRNALGQTKKKLLKIIDTLPDTVEKAYEKILARCEQEKARIALLIIVAAQRPLSLSEIDVALEIQVDGDSLSTTYADLDCEGSEGRKRWIRKACGLFVSVVDSRVYLIHQTAREFLVQKNNTSVPQKWRCSIDLQSAHQALAMRCIIYLLFHEFRKFRYNPTDTYGPSHSGQTLAVLEYKKKYPFLDYSANHWIAHVHEAHIESSTWDSRTAKLCDIGDGSSCVWFRIHSLSNYRSRKLYRSKQSVLYWAAVFGLAHVTKFLLGSGVDPNSQGSHVGNALQAVAHGGHETARKRLLYSSANINTNGGIYATAIEAACTQGHLAILEILLAPRPCHWDQAIVTSGALKAAAGNMSRGEDVMSLLIERRGTEVKITEEVVEAAAKEGSEGVMALLLERRGNEIKITEEVVRAAASNWNRGVNIMTLLLERRGAEVKITEEVLKEAASNPGRGKDIMALLLERRGNEVKITKEVVRAAVSNWGRGIDIMELLLERRGNEVKITKEVVRAASSNWERGKDIMTPLIKCHMDKFVISDGLVAQIARSYDRRVMGLLLERRGDEGGITEEVVRAAASNWGRGTDIMALLLESHANKIVISAGLIAEIARSFDQGMMALLLERRGDEIKITEEVVKAAASSLDRGRDIMAFLLESHMDKIVLSEGLIAEIARSFNERMTALLLERRGDEVKITEEVVRAAASSLDRGRDIIALLLEQRGDEVKITDGVVEAAVGNRGEDVIMFLIKRRGDEVKITEEAVRAAASNWGRGDNIMTLLIGRHADKFIISEGLVAEIARSFDPSVITLFLEKRGGEVMITEEVVKAAAGNPAGKGALKFLLERDPTLLITEEVIKAAAWNPDGKGVLEFLHKRDPALTITEEVIKTAAWNPDGKGALEFLLEKDPTLLVTEEVVKAAARSPDGKGALEFLFEKDPSLPVTKEVVKAAVCNPSGKKVVEFLLDVHPRMSISGSFIDSIEEGWVWTSLLKLSPFHSWDESSLRMTHLREVVLQNLKETKSFLKAKAVRGRQVDEVHLK